MMNNYFENLYLNYKLGYLNSENIHNYIIKYLEENKKSDMIFWEFSSLQKPFKHEVDYYFNRLISEKHIIEFEQFVLVNIALDWWIRKKTIDEGLLIFLRSSQKNEEILGDMYDELIDFLEVEWRDYENYEPMITEIQNHLVQNNYQDNPNYFPLNFKNNESLLSNNKSTNIFKGLKFIHYIKIILVLPFFILFLLLSLLKYLFKKTTANSRNFCTTMLF